jgi:hypothetical protein
MSTLAETSLSEAKRRALDRIMRFWTRDSARGGALSGSVARRRARSHLGHRSPAGRRERRLGRRRGASVAQAREVIARFTRFVGGAEDVIGD